MTLETSSPKLLVTSREAAKMLSISERTLWTLSHSGELNIVRIGRSVRYAIADIQEYIERCRRESFIATSHVSSTNEDQ